MQLSRLRSAGSHCSAVVPYSPVRCQEQLTLAVVDNERELLTTDTAFYVPDDADGRLTLRTTTYRCGPMTDGSTPAARCGPDHETPGRKGMGAIYHFHRGELKRLYAKVTMPNAICFSPAGGTAYVSDTRTALLRRVAIDPLTALPTGEPQTLCYHRGQTRGLDGQGRRSASRPNIRARGRRHQTPRATHQASPSTKPELRI
ncbi:hypothetical protein ABID58_002947 [Bradyrhizobium sp. S3.2.6]|uniref:SMP-30/gluconolactonase/LRE family protein n=1 Tax=Bradyrhizobium sp. S3.2.6 TaxID=3156428 RepID=UPI003390988D